MANNFAQKSENVAKTTERSFGNSFRMEISPRNPNASSKQQDNHPRPTEYDAMVCPKNNGLVHIVEKQQLIRRPFRWKW